MGEGCSLPEAPGGPPPTFQAQRSALCCPHQGLSLAPTSSLPLMMILWSCAPPSPVNLGRPPSQTLHRITSAGSPWSREVTGSRDLDMGDGVFVQPTSGPCDMVLLAVESARDAQEGWMQSRSPREMPLPPGASGTHAGEFPHLFPLIPRTWGAARRGSRGHTRLPPPGAGSAAGPFGPSVLHCGWGQLLEPPEGLGLGVCV